MKRRSFMKNGAGHLALSTAYMYGLQSLLDACFRANLAQAQETSGIRYVNIQMPGAPPRWMFDQPLNPFNKGDQFVAGNFGTQIVKSGSKFSAVHRDLKVQFGDQEVYLPPVWSLKSAASGKSFSEVLNNTMMIRGVDMEINSHGVNQTRIVRPVASQPSIHGLLADQSKLPLVATGQSGIEGSRAFKSETGVSLIEVPLADPIPTLLSSFSGTITKSAELSITEADIIEALDNYANKKKLASVGAEKQQTAAYEMFTRNLGAFKSQWSALYTKYRNIISAEINATFPGITSVNASNSDSSDNTFRYNRTASFVGNLNSTLRSTTSMNAMAQSFAFAEFALTQNLSSAISVSIGGTTINSLQTIGNVSNDQHFLGSVNSTFYTSLMYRSLLGCISELIGQLKTAGLFDSTVLHVGAEFSRTPKTNGSGADHGFNGSSATLISGMISTPGLVGNISKEAQSAGMRTSYKGTYGEASNFFDETTAIVNDDVVNTICEMLEVRKVAVKGQSLVQKASGKASWAKSWGMKNV